MYTRWYTKQSVIGLTLTLLVALMIEHSWLDMAISNWLYIQDGLGGHWWLDKGRVLPNLVFYTLPKRLLMVLVGYVTIAWLQRVVQSRQGSNNVLMWYRNVTWFRPLCALSRRELGYLSLTMITIPAVSASLKVITHVSCPNHLTVFGGELAYLTIWQSMLAQIPAQCFPAAHASSGFALYAWAFVPHFWQARWRIIGAVTLLAWVMGGYKMLIGDHFFSHTLVSMALAWTLCSVLARRAFR